eukprot:TRINITY_DN9702_c0_g1_i1.p1 TRINITY_DN9702_c0_g1~~TRINITY_DN9702_c0_g1_i1.p1  ORF type:complete len:447 (+),score=73.10 TRINITY_DN9702_c0_g1_i1:62-1402(+)
MIADPVAPIVYSYQLSNEFTTVANEKFANVEQMIAELVGFLGDHHLITSPVSELNDCLGSTLNKMKNLVKMPVLPSEIWVVILDMKYQNFLWKLYNAHKAKTFKYAIGHLKHEKYVLHFIRSYTQYKQRKLSVYQTSIVRRYFPESVSICDLYLENLLRSSVVSERNTTVLMHAARYSPNKVEELLNNGCLDIINEKNAKKYTALSIACKYQPSCVEMLINAGGLINARNYIGHSPLMIACGAQQFETVCLLLEKNCNVNNVDLNGINALLIACMMLPEVVKSLLEAGIDVNVKDEAGSNALAIASEYNPELIQILIDYNCDIYSRDNCKRTPLMIACQYSTEAAITLLNNGCDVNAKDENGTTALMMACETNPLLVYKLINAKCELDEQECDGYTALMIACMYSPISVPSLLAAGCNVDIENKFSETAISIARKNGRIQLFKQLI